MAKPALKVATIVGSSTDTAWSQTYHAGGVTAIVSVTPKEGEETSSLSLVGKDLLNTFESEYFTLENKNLASIKQAVEETYNKSKDTHTISLIVSSVIQNAVYVVLAGAGKILLLRKGALATLLEQQEETVLSASGFLQDSDVMVLETLSFAKKIDADMLLETIKNNALLDAAEILSPTIHKDKDGSAAALLFHYQEEKTQHMPTIPNQAEQTEELPPQEVTDKQEDKEQAVITTPPLRNKKKFHISHRQKLFLTIAVILAIVFVGTIYFSLQKKQTTRNSALFSQLYPPAERKYEEGQALQSLNASLAHDDFAEAQQMLEAAKGKFTTGSSEEKQILSLLDKVNAQLGTTNTPTNTTSLIKVDASTSPFLTFAAKHLSAKYFAQDDSNFYFADNTGITKQAKSASTGQQIIQNGGDWKSLGGFETYLGNMYILDTSDGIDKYPVAASGYGSKAAYFSTNAPDLSKAVSIAIDGSVWILENNGSITKYTKGSQDSFTPSGLTKSFNSPTQIVTTVDDDNVYILDNGNSRLVVLKKDGTFVTEYTNQQLKSATQMDIDESGKKAYLLIGSDIYELDMK